jgi:hypothetical protein
MIGLSPGSAQSNCSFYISFCFLILPAVPAPSPNNRDGKKGEKGRPVKKKKAQMLAGMGKNA